MTARNLRVLVRNNRFSLFACIWLTAKTSVFRIPILRSLLQNT